MPNERRYSNELNLESVGINLPYNMQAEQSVLGAVLLKPDTLTDLVEILKPEMFYTRQNAQIWTEMLRLFTNDQTIDFVTLLDAVVSDGVFPSADEAKIYLTGLAETVPSISNVKAYAQIVQEKYLVRQLMGVAKDILQDAGDEPDADLLLENAEQRIYEIRSGRDSSTLTPLSSSMVETLTNLQKISGPDADKYKGIPTGFRLLDTVLTGLGRGDLVILAARPGMGKTSFALNIATRVAMQQKVPVAIFSLEMTKEQLTNRILSSEAGIDSQAFRTGALRAEDWEYLALATEKLHDAPIYMDDTSGITITEMKAKIRRVNQDPARPNVGLIVIDYLQLMTTGQRSENLAGSVGSITDPADRIDGKAPATASYVSIRVLWDGAYFDYKVYLGSNTTSDFNVRRNTLYDYDVTIEGVNADDLRIAMTEIIFWVGRKLSIGGRYYRDGFYWNTRVAYSQLEIVTDNCDPGEEYAVSFRSLSGTFHSDWKMEYMIFSLPAEQREYKPIAPGERITVHKGNGTSVVIFAFSNYEGTKNYNTTDNYFEFTVCDSRGRGRTAVLSTNRDEWFK